MFKLKSKKLERDFNVTDGYLYASQIKNLCSGMTFIPDGSGSEFEIHFKDGDTLSSKSLALSEALERDGKLFFRFKEEMKTTVTLTYRIGSDGETLEKQIALEQSEPKSVDYVMLENIGITNSASSYTASGGKSEIDEFYSNLGQPFYIDSLFFGCVFPGTKNGVFHGRGEVVYFIGKSAENKIICPTTVMGAAESAMITDLKSAFFEYIKRIAVPSDFRVQYNTWYDRMMDIDADNSEAAFYRVEQKLSSNGVAPLEGYVLDDGWNNYRAGFWSINQKRFPNGFLDLSSLAGKLGGGFGLWLGPRGGYNYNSRFAKRIERAGFGYYNAESDDICVCSKKYLKELKDFLVKATKENDIGYWKLDGFALKPCRNQKHDHITGGDHDMYYITELWRRWIKIFKAMREARAAQGKELWINFTCYVNPSPWWLQYVNTVWLQNSGDIGFAANYPRGEQPQADAEMTYRDSVYYDFLVTRGLQFPLCNIYNHEPIYGREAKLSYNESDFEKAMFWNACRGSALCELYISDSMMDDEKWQILSRVLNWQRKNHHILKNAMLLGGDPAQNNVYCYAAWTREGEGIIGLRNPTNEPAPLTLTLNKLMGCPESLKDARRYNVLNRSAAESADLYDYNDKINLTLQPFEVKIFQFGRQDERYDDPGEVNDFTIVFEYDGADGIICQNNDIRIAAEKGMISADVGRLRLRSENLLSDSNHTVTLVREKNRMVKLYIGSTLDCSDYDPKAKARISCELTSDAEGFRVINSATAYDDIVELGGALKKSRKRRRR